MYDNDYIIAIILNGFKRYYRIFKNLFQNSCFLNLIFTYICKIYKYKNMSKKVFYSCLLRSFNPSESDPTKAYTNDLKVEVDTDGFDNYEDMLEDIAERAIIHQNKNKENTDGDILTTILLNIKTFRENNLNTI